MRLSEDAEENPSEIVNARELAVKYLSPKTKKAAVITPIAIIRSGIMKNINIKDTFKQHLSGVKLFEHYLTARKKSLTCFNRFSPECVMDFRTWLQTEYINPKDYKAFERLNREQPEKVLRFVEDYITEPTTQATIAAVPSNLGEEICIGSSIYVWVHRCERLNKIAELYERVYHFEKIDEVQGDYQLLKFTEDFTR